MVNERSYGTIEDYLDELNCKDFCNGVEKSIRHSQRSNCETAFTVDFHPNLGFFYPLFIAIGDERSVTQHIPRYTNLPSSQLLDYPISKGREEKDSLIDSEFETLLIESAIRFHTHVGISSHSKEDLGVLNYYRHKSLNRINPI